MESITAPSPAVTAEVSIEVAMPAPPDRVWTTLVDEIGRWWPEGFFMTPEPRRLGLEARPGGRLAEISETGGGLLWYTVIALDPPGSLQMAGHIFPAFGGPATSFVTITIEAAGGGSILRVTDSLVGRIDPSALPKIESGWRCIFEGGLKAHLDASA